MTLETLGILVASNYAFKAASALVDTIPFYLLVAWMRRYLQLGENEFAVFVTDPETET